MELVAAVISRHGTQGSERDQIIIVNMFRSLRPPGFHDRYRRVWTEAIVIGMKAAIDFHKRESRATTFRLHWHG